MLPGFTLSDGLVVKKLDFDLYRLDNICPNKIEGEPVDSGVPKECVDEIIDVFHQYYEYKPEIEKNNPGATYFSLAVYEEDAPIVARKLAEKIRIYISPVFQSADIGVRKYSYKEFLQEFSEENHELEVSWNELSDTEIDPDKVIQNEIPNGIEKLSFEFEDYQKFVSEYVFPVIQQTEWRGGNAWLCNLGFRELRNGRYKSAAYAFEGARIGLTKHSLWEETRINEMVDNSLVSLRELCLYHVGEGKLPERRKICDLENRDLVFIPEFLEEPEYPKSYFVFSDQIWVANALVLVQAVAHAMELPTISKTEVDPFGEDLSIRNWTFVIRLAKKLYEDYIEQKAIRKGIPSSSGFSTFDNFDLTQFSPEIALTRILESSGYNIRVYGGELEVEQGLKVQYDFRADKGETDYLVRALRQEDQSKEKVYSLTRKLSGKETELLLLYDEEVNAELIDEFRDEPSVNLYYVDLINERIRPVSAGYPESYSNLTTKSSIKREIKRRYEKAKTADGKNEKGDALEELMDLIFEKAVPDTEVVDTNIRTRVEEIDLQLNNKEQRFPWNKLGTDVLVECKNWTEPAGVDVIYTVFGKAQMLSPDCKGVILVCWEGISDGHRNKNGDQLVREVRQKGVNIIVLNGEDLEKIAETGNAQEVLRAKANELGMR